MNMSQTTLSCVIRCTDMLSAPLWDPVKCQFVGILTVTDFIDVLFHYRATGKDAASLAVHSIAELLTQLAAEKELAGNEFTTSGKSGGSPKNHRLSILRPFQGAGTQCTLQQACQQLLATGQDFLPICFAADMRVLACITYTNILEHLVTHFREQRRLFDDSVADLGIGTYGEEVIMVTPQHTLAEALQAMHSAGLSAVPVVDSMTNRKVIGVYSRSDITFLTKATDAEDAVRNLDLPLSEILSQGRPDVTTPDALRTCSPSHTLQAIFESFAIQRFNRLCVVDAEERLVGVVSAKDLVAYFFE
jgi:5'-AMP-activated protein kinase, regulatory gamma subunit